LSEVLFYSYITKYNKNEYNIVRFLYHQINYSIELEYYTCLRSELRIPTQIYQIKRLYSSDGFKCRLRQSDNFYGVIRISPYPTLQNEIITSNGLPWFNNRYINYMKKSEKWIYWGFKFPLVLICVGVNDIPMLSKKDDFKLDLYENKRAVYKVIFSFRIAMFFLGVKTVFEINWVTYKVWIFRNFTFILPWFNGFRIHFLDLFGRNQNIIFFGYLCMYFNGIFKMDTGYKENLIIKIFLEK